MGFFDALASIAATDATNTVNQNINNASLGFQKQENAKQRNYDWAKMKAEQQWQQSMYEMYNTPSAMKQMYREAGINPFIAGSNAIGEAMTTNAPTGGAPSVGSVPSMIPMQAPHFAGMDESIFSALKVNSEIGNQTSQMFRNLMEAVSTALKDNNLPLAYKLVELGAPMIKGINFDSSQLKEQVRLMNEQQQIINRIKEIDAQVAEEVGMSNARQVLANMRQQLNESQAQVDFWQNVKKLNDATVGLRRAQQNSEWKLAKKYEEEIPVLRSQVKELNSRAYMEFAHGSLSDAKTLTEDTLREFYSSQQKYKALSMGIDYEILSSDFESNDWKRDVQKSLFGKFTSAWNFGVDEAISKPLKSFMDIFGDLPKLSKPKFKR